MTLQRTAHCARLRGRRILRADAVGFAARCIEEVRGGIGPRGRQLGEFRELFDRELCRPRGNAQNKSAAWSADSTPLRPLYAVVRGLPPT